MTEEPNTKRILLVCTGNICRSPLAAALLERALVERGIEGLAVASAGTGAWDGAPVSEGAYLVGLERGLDLSGHRARLLTRELVDGADLILTMARHHRARVDELGGEGHVSVLGEYAGREGDEAEVSDPFGGDLDVYRDTCVELEALLQTAVERIVKEFASGSQRWHTPAGGDRRSGRPFAFPLDAECRNPRPRSGCRIRRAAHVGPGADHRARRPRRRRWGGERDGAA